MIDFLIKRGKSIVIVFLVLICICSCTSSQKKIDDKIKEKIKDYWEKTISFADAREDLIILKTTYYTIGTGCWSYNLAKIMLHNPEIFTDNELLEELQRVSQQIDTNDSRKRIIAEVYWVNKNARGLLKYCRELGKYSYIGLIGDSLTNVEENEIEALLNISTDNEAVILDIAKTVNLIGQGIPLSVEDNIIRFVSGSQYSGNNSKLKYCKTDVIYEDNNKSVDDLVNVQFLGIKLYDNIDSIISQSPKNKFKREFLIDDYCCYSTQDELTLKDEKWPIDIRIYTIDNKVSMIKIVTKAKSEGKCCFIKDNTNEILEMYRLKYGPEKHSHLKAIDENFIYSIDKFFTKKRDSYYCYYESEKGVTTCQEWYLNLPEKEKVYEILNDSPGWCQEIYVWDFSKNGIIIVRNEGREYNYVESQTYKKDPVVISKYHSFQNNVILYFDKQLYRKIKFRENELVNYIKRQQFVSDSLNRDEKKRNDSIKCSIEDKKRKENLLQI